MGLRLYNTLTGRKEEFTPLDPENVRMYVCGPTVYDFAHIGNARPVIVFDVLFRLLRHLYGADYVTYVRNITDVDDKINARAAQEYPDLPLNEAIRKVTERTEKQFHEDVAALGCLPPTHEPRATEFISRSDTPEDMVRLIGKLVEKGFAYPAEGHVLFEVAKDPDYGKLAHRSLDDMLAGARVDVAPYKRDPMDFVLWKPSKPGEPSWPSPWGPGRPGWHIECSAMAGALLGETFDIHGGGIDLVFPHHENELAQSRSAHGTPRMAQVWMHNGFLQVEGKKMAKSEGNFVTIRDLLAGGQKPWPWHGSISTEAPRPWPGEVVRLTMLATHYRKPIDFAEPNLAHWRARLSHWIDCSYGFGPISVGGRPVDHVPTAPSVGLVRALSDDLNMSEGIKVLDVLARKAVRQEEDAASQLRSDLLWLGLVRGQYRNAYMLRVSGNAAPSLLSEYEQELRGARAIVLNEFKFADSEEEQKARISSINARVNSLYPRMAKDGLALNVSDALVVSLEPTRSESAIDQVWIDRMKEARAAARKAGNFAEADRIRDELGAMGIQLKDSKDPNTGELVTTWEVKR